MDSDKELECQRYDNRAASLLSKNEGFSSVTGSNEIPLSLRAPYLFYESQIKENVTSEKFRVLEIGAGTGAFTWFILATGAQVYATDISINSLSVLEKKYEGYDNLQTQVADMESLPFDNEFFDIITSAGSLSYGDNAVVRNEIHRVLKKGGVFICVDSLNENLIYRLNRRIGYLRGQRTLSTIKRMPTLGTINDYKNKFHIVKLSFFGSLTWLSPLIALALGKTAAGKLMDKFDLFINVYRSAFKFVMVVRKS